MELNEIFEQLYVAVEEKISNGEYKANAYDTEFSKEIIVRIENCAEIFKVTICEDGSFLIEIAKRYEPSEIVKATYDKIYREGLRELIEQNQFAIARAERVCSNEVKASIDRKDYIVKQLETEITKAEEYLKTEQQ